MDFTPTEDRRMLADSLSRFLADTCPLDARKSKAYDAPFHDPAAFAGLAELGALMALAPESAGGMGGAGFDIATVFEELGRVVCPEPILPVAMAVPLFLAGDADLDPVFSGETRLAIAIGEPEAPWSLDHLATAAVKGAEGWQLTGRKSLVYGANDADTILVVARVPDGLATFSVKATDAELTGYGLMDGGGAAELFLDNTPATLLCTGDGPVKDALARGRLALCAEALGAMQTAQAYTMDYLGARKQFGVPIGSFQALQHRMIDMMIEIEQVRSIVTLAADRLDTEARDHTIAMAKSLTGRVCRHVAEESIQMHGGIGMTWEADISHVAKRLTLIDAQLGDEDFHLSTVMTALQA
ncbi:MAG: acyl-CoA dehydrogenase [Rhodobacterales bacterium]|nr:MAG: acyl-CoA dehydrogenase [Rhodobacterales bacterium]